MAKSKKSKKSVTKLSVSSHETKQLATKSTFANNYGATTSTAGLTINSDDEHKVLSGESLSGNVDIDSIDHSITREPINIGVKNVRQILSCIKDGTTEVKDIILNECNIIYECKICLSLFRSLANLIAHKRIYCKKHFCEKMVLFDSTVLQFNEDEDDEEHENEDEDAYVEEHNDSGNVTAVDMVSPASSMTANMTTSVTASITTTNETICNANINSNCNYDKSTKQKRKFIDNCIAKVEHENSRQLEANQLDLKLSSIKTNKNAVFQMRLTSEPDSSIVNNETTNENTENNDNISTELENKKEIINKLLKEAKNDMNNCTDINEIQALKRQRLEEILPHYSDDNKDVHSSLIVKCEICNSTFTSRKTFKVHLKTIHSTNRLVYPCPLCSLTFKQLSNATRHIIQIHKRTKTQANTLREVMRRRAYSANSSENSSEVEDASDDEDSHESSECERVKDNGDESSPKDISIINMSSSENGNAKPNERTKCSSRINASCIYNCGNIFDWAPAKRSHEKSCRKRFTQNDDLEVKPVFEVNGNSIPSSVSHHYSQSQKPLLIKQNSLSSDINNESSLCSPNITNITNATNSELILVPNHTSNSTISNITLPHRVEEQIKQFTDLKSLQCTQCPTQDFMNLNQLIQHAVSHVGYNVYRCHGCSFHSIIENDMKSHLKNNHNIGEDMLSKHYQSLPTLNQPRLLIVPLTKARKSINGPNCNKPVVPIVHEHETSNNRDHSSNLLKIHLRNMGNTDKKCYEIVDK